MAGRETPSENDLQNYLLGNLIQDIFNSIDQRLDDDSELSQRLSATSQITSDTLIEALRSIPKSPDLESDSAYQRGLELVRQIGRDWSSSPPAHAPGGDADTDTILDLGTIRDYRLLKQLGKGGMGTVYKALHTHLGKVVALKVLPKDRLQDPVAVSRFKREMKIVGGFQHPNIVSATDGGEHDGRHFLVMEHVDGENLSDYVRRNGPFSPAHAFDLLRQTADGLQYAHNYKEGIFHRDIKPSNLMVTPEDDSQSGSRLHVKILDFGLARLEAPPADDDASDTDRTQQGVVMGTVDYMSPEQARDTRSANALSDIYSLGCTLFFLLNGRPPYGGNTQMERLLAHSTKPIPQLIEKPTKLDNATVSKLQSLFAKMVAKEPEDRFQSMAEVLEAIEQIPLPQKPLQGTTRLIGDPAASETLSSTQLDKTIPQEPGSNVAESSSFDKTKPATKSAQTWWDQLRRSRYRQWVIGALTLLVLIGVIYIATKNPGWKVNSTGSDVNVDISGDGKTITAVDKQTGTKVTQSLGGKTRIQTKGNASVKLTSDGFEITRGGVVIFSAERTTRSGRPAVIASEESYPLLEFLMNLDGWWQWNSALVFDGMNDFIEWPVEKKKGDRVLVFQGDDPVTIEAIVNPDRRAPPRDQVLFGWDPVFSAHYNTKAGLSVSLRDAGGKPVSMPAVTALPAGALHVALVWDGQRVHLFVNEALASSSGTFRPAFEKTALDNLCVGAGLHSTKDGKAKIVAPYRGTVDELRLSAGARYTAKGKTAKSLPTLQSPQHLLKDDQTIVLYHFDGTWDGVLTDDTNQELHARIYGAKSPLADFLSTFQSTDNFALQFDGKDDYVEVPDLRLQDFRQYTVECRVWIQNVRTANVVSWTGSNWGAIYQSGGWGVARRIGERSLLKRATEPPIAGRWVHLAATWDGKDARLFIDGKPVPTTQQNYQLGTTMPGFFIGGVPITHLPEKESDRFFSGRIDDIRISKIVRYKDEFSVPASFQPDSDTIALYSCNRGQGDQLADESGNAHHATLFGASWAPAPNKTGR